MHYLYKGFARLFFIISVITVVIFVAKGWQLITDGFRKDKIAQDAIYDPKWDVLYRPQEEKKILSLLDQPFYYLGKGCQVYVFGSSDQKYVIKFIRYHKYRLPFWMHYITFCSKGADYKAYRMDHRKRGYFNSLRSYKIAYDLLSRETKTLYIHLNPTDHLKKKLQIIDRLGRKDIVDLDHSGFLVQEKVQSLEPYLLQLKNAQNMQETKKVIDSFLMLVDSLYRKGMTNKDYNCLKNSGYLNGQVVGMDIGSFYPQEGLENPQEFEQELRNFVKHFRKWGIKKYPEILPIFDAKVDQLIEKKKNQCAKEF